MHRLTCTFAVDMWHKTCFLTSWLKTKQSCFFFQPQLCLVFSHVQYKRFLLQWTSSMEANLNWIAKAVATIMILIFWTDMPGQTVQTQIRLLLEEQSDQSLHCLPSVCIVWTHYSMVEPHSSNFRVSTTNFLGVRIFRKFTVLHALWPTVSQDKSIAGQEITVIKWTASSEFGAYRLCEQRRFRRACAFAQSRQNLRCSLIQAVSQEEPSDRKPDPWPLWMSGHAQLKFVMTECSKTQIRLTGLMSHWHDCNKQIE